MKPSFKTITLSLMLLGSVVASASTADTTAKEKPWKLKWSGIINPHFYADSREVVGGREEMMLFYQKPQNLDADGNDINEDWNLNMLAITARLGLTVTGPDMLGAQTKGYIEGDFTGATNATINNLRLRHAYVNMDWGNSELLMGQYWYPMVIHEIMPNTRPLNMGAPFHPYARYNQVRFTQKHNNWEAVGVASFQLDNTVDGPLGASTTYLRHSCIPELNLQARYNGARLFAGVAYNFECIQPRQYFTDSEGKTHKDNTLFSSQSFTAFLKYKMDCGWNVSAQYLLANNLSEGASMGGYFETFTPQGYEYQNYGFNLYWLDFGKATGHWRPGIFLGYGNNRNCGSLVFNPETKFYGRGWNIDYLFRIQPRIGYHANNNLNFYLEAEYTYAQYTHLVRKTDIPEDNNMIFKPVNNTDVLSGNLRLMFSAEYRF